MSVRACRVLVGFALTLVTGVTVAAPPASTSAAMSERRGYWWKDEPPPAAEEQPKDLGSPPEEAALLAMHPREVEKLIEDYRSNAVWKTTPETVRWYYELQDFARRRARAFMNVTQLVMLETPDVNMQTVYPTNPVGQEARVAQRSQSVTRRIAAERDRAALVLLTREGCEFCEAQRGVLTYFADRHGWEVREIDIGRDPALARRFATDYTPTTVVIFRDGGAWQPVSVGVETLEALEEGVYRALRYVLGETDPSQYSLQEFQQGGPYDPARRLPRSTAPTARPSP